jgi:DNA-directed RNA polymerase specialized sigma24 family protein
VPGSADETNAAAEFGYRPLLFSVAYGMTGSVGDAEDLVQDAFVGLTRARQAGTVITDPKAYLTTAVTRLGINHLRSARVQRVRTGPGRGQGPVDPFGGQSRQARPSGAGV